LLAGRGVSDGGVRRELFPKIRSELLSHEKAELQEVYPAFKQYPDLESMVMVHDEAAEELEELIALPY
jgi:hypothetical protein